MEKSKGAILRAQITYYFKETFRAHSKAEYREIFSRGLNEDNEGLTGAFPWLYVRAFFALFILFTVNTLILRLTNNALYVPSVTFLGGVTFTIPFIVLLYELYPRRDLSFFMLMAVLVVGGTVSSILTQFGYTFISVKNEWVSAVLAGVLEEICKAVTAIFAISLLKQKNPYACFLVAAAVGAGFSVIEDMGYIFYYSDKYVFYYHSDIQATLALFLDRGMSSFCTHVLWTGAVGWAYSISKRPFRSLWLIILASSVALHICWNLPLEGVWHVLIIIFCVITVAVINIAIIYKSLMNTIAAEEDFTRLNERIIKEAKEMGELMRFRNAANLTFSLTCTFLSIIVLILCALPIGMDYQSVVFDDKYSFIAYVEDGYNLICDWHREYDPNGLNVLERSEYDEEEGRLVLNYVEQKVEYEGYDGTYFYGYYLNDKGAPYEISVELDEINSRIGCKEYTFDKQTVWVYEVNTHSLIDYNYNSDETVTAVIDAEEFEGSNLLIALCGAACAISAGCTIILIAFKIKLRRVRDE